MRRSTWGAAGTWLAVAIAHRWWSRSPAGSLARAISDGLAHAALGLATSLPAARCTPDPKRVLAGALLGALVIDLDHIAAARSIRLQTCMTMPQRPVTHSLVIALGLTAAAVRADRYLGTGFGLGLGSHLLRDLVTGGVPLFHPRRVVQLREHLALPLVAGLAAGGWWLVRVVPNEASSRNSVLK
ncbi:metal-dependent hydrolase [Thermomicrobium sp. 4228-Ro]|uniref:metal-dependent hydrolase n=1 Tax=Thermomicrobium sp. 4228-Ro TaxID=2993937 RepID=UPI0022496296|nr:metal-dependent hydrolase [Thermomicrobium sp. 4228-Ro]MCX2727225.1 metal-dependent hydrolase [Thermomicrobium sp. 4228-Ro]